MSRGAFFNSAGAAPDVKEREALRQMQAGHAIKDKSAVDMTELLARALVVLDQDKMTRAAEYPQKNVAAVPLPRSASLEPTPDGRLALQRRLLSDGAECFLPIRYFDVQCLVATFLTELDRAAELLKGTGLQAVPQEDGKAVVVLYCIEYRKTDLGPYNEVGLTVLTVASGDPIPANYVLNLPVTNLLPSRAGREIWGYNKFVTPIDVHSNGKNFTTILRDPENEMIGKLEGRRDSSVPVPPNDILTFTLLGGRTIKTLIQVLTPFHASSGDGFVFTVGTSRHPMANNLRTLMLDGARPVLVHYADPFQALLFPGRAV
jgi:hypothetical protein